MFCHKYRDFIFCMCLHESKTCIACSYNRVKVVNIEMTEGGPVDCNGNQGFKPYLFVNTWKNSHLDCACHSLVFVTKIIWCLIANTFMCGLAPKFDPSDFIISQNVELPLPQFETRWPNIHWCTDWLKIPCPSLLVCESQVWVYSAVCLGEWRLSSFVVLIAYVFNFLWVVVPQFCC